MTDNVKSELAFDAPNPESRTWGDAFPWLAGAASGAEVAWWNESIEGRGFGDRIARIAQISELAMERLTRWTIGQIFPGLASDIDLLQLGLPVRAANALTRFNCETSGLLMSLELEEVMDWRQVGAGTVDSILRALIELSVSTPTPTVTNQIAEFGEDSLTFPDGKISKLSKWLSPPLGDFVMIADWLSTIGMPEQSILSAPMPPGTPVEVVEARRRIDAIEAHEFLSQWTTELDVAGHFDHAIGRLDSRAIHVLSTRLFADNPSTLEELGQAHGVSRERIRQIEGKARGALLTYVSEDEAPLASVAEYARELIGTIRPLDDLLELIPALGRTVTQVDLPAWRVLDSLDDAYEIADGWCAVPTMTAAVSVTQTLLEERCNQYGVVRLDEIELVQSSHPERLPHLTASWLSHCGYVLHGQFVLTRTSSVGDYAAGLLSINGTPLSSQMIVDRFVFERSVRSLSNALSSDERFERVDRDRWALTEWGMEAYTGIRSIIRELVARDGGRAKLNDIVEHITARYSVSGSSVIAYAGAVPFITKDGIVQLDTDGRSARKPPQNTQRLFRRPDGWAYRARITSDHLRGSGSVAPAAIATILDLQAGQTLQLPSPLGPQTIAWTGIQPSFGTIRRFLMEQDVPADTEAFLVIQDNGTFSFEQVRELVDDPLPDALSLIGSAPTSDREAARSALTRAIDLPEGSPVSSIIGGYRSRGDDDIAELLLTARERLETDHTPGQRHHSADVDEIMDLL